MSRGTHSHRLMRACKAFIISFIMLFLILLIIGVLLRYTSLPERWSHIYILAALCISCFTVGLMTGSIIGKRGILIGGLASIVFLLAVIIFSVLITGIQSETGLFEARFIPCVITGSLGGMFGVRVKHD